ncbi:hypothetical protein IP84_04210 [beta proteobacterium AAP99]|nr:hypothetical protein IP84_04210 [beta proteobacterium AAP99]
MAGVISNWQTLRRLAGAATLAILVSACGGSGGGSSGPAAPPPGPPPTAAEASRFLSQATMGPTQASIDFVIRVGYQGWLNDQFNKPMRPHFDYLQARQAELQALMPPQNVGQNEFFQSWWGQALGSEDQLRQRVTFALSEIFVVSFQNDATVNYPRGMASYYDMLAKNAFGNYRTLLEDVSRHPMMGLYLTHMRNQKAGGTRVPDENYAREVMQLFSIGLFQLNPDGTVRTDSSGRPLETYGDDDIKGLSRVFTGFSWYAGPNMADRTDSRFFGGAGPAEREWTPMQGYAKFHEQGEKRFLGTTIAAQTTADPDASLKAALDFLAAHPNTAPFISKLLIQRLVTSNPSPAYVGRVSNVFRTSNGDLKQVISAILLDTEARTASTANNVGKLREPILRATAWGRAFGATSDSTRFLMGSTDDPLGSLSQTPMRSPTVFNFFRAGYVPPNSAAGGANLTAPEFQIVHETSVVGYMNFMRNAVQNGIGGRATGATRNDIQPNYTAEIALAERPDDLVNRLDMLLTGGSMTTANKQIIRDAINSVAIPALAANGSNQAQVDAAKLTRARLGVYLTLASPEFLIQK